MVFYSHLVSIYACCQSYKVLNGYVAVYGGRGPLHLFFKNTFLIVTIYFDTFMFRMSFLLSRFSRRVHIQGGAGVLWFSCVWSQTDVELVWSHLSWRFWSYGQLDDYKVLKSMHSLGYSLRVLSGPSVPHHCCCSCSSITNTLQVDQIWQYFTTSLCLGLCQ